MNLVISGLAYHLSLQIPGMAQEVFSEFVFFPECKLFTIDMREHENGECGEVVMW